MRYYYSTTYLLVGCDLNQYKRDAQKGRPVVKNGILGHSKMGQ
jgi:hypothetical protein